MTDTTKQQRLLADGVVPPVITDPVEGYFYSPVAIKINLGEGEDFQPTEFEVDFYPHGPVDMFKAPVQSHFDQDLPLGPQELHTRGRLKQSGIEFHSEWVIRTFFVLTPPAP